ncbi:MAG: hypothetical protein OXE58_07745 [Acidobacteria bacterium]|nr:hypothetical protein [Acidobacteriota bacterium]
MLRKWVARCGFDRLAAVDAGQRPALRTRAAGAGLEAGVPSRYAVKGTRRSASEVVALEE